jgi:hypothetical protein
LVAQLEKRAREARGRYRLSIEALALSLDVQVARPGPVWLDTLDPEHLAARGFGAEVRAACERRRQALEERDLERRALGRALARQNGQVFLEPAPDHLRGRLEPGPEGSAYLAVTDGKQFVLVPAAREARSRMGQLVDVSRDASGRLRLVEQKDNRVDLALRAAGEKIARQTRMTFLEAVPERFTGRVREGPAESAYCVVSSGTRFVLVPATSEVLALRGRTVEVGRDAQGRFVGLRPRERDHDLGR